MQNDNLCAMVTLAQTINKKQDTPQKHHGPNQRVWEATTLNAETRDWLGFSMSIVILVRGHGSGSVDRQCSNSEVRSDEITGRASPCGR